MWQGIRVAVLGCVIATTGAPAVAQDEAPIETVPGLRADTTFTNVYVNDNFAAVDALAKARVLASRGRWSAAATLLQQVSDTADDKLTRLSPGRYIGLRPHINQLIADWPAAGLSAYESVVDARLQRALAALGNRRRLNTLVELFGRYFCTPSAAALADAIGQLAIEDGDLALARYVYRRVVDQHPNPGDHRRHARTMLALLDAMDGRNDEDTPADATPIRWKGQEQSLGAIARDLSEAFPDLSAPISPSDWPIFGGNPERARHPMSRVDDPGVLWRFDATTQLGSGNGSDAVQRTIQREGNEGSAGIQPVVQGGFIYTQFPRAIVALHRRTGAVAWTYSFGDSGSTGLTYIDEHTPNWGAVTVAGDRLYASLPGDPVPYYSYESPRNAAELICLNALTGAIVWRLDRTMIQEAFAEVSFDSSPVIVRNRLFVVGRRRRSFGFEDCYLYCLDAVTGAMIFRTHVGSASTGSFGSRQATRSVIALHEDTAYVCSNLGTVAAVLTYSGEVQWLTMYGRNETPGGTDSTRSVRNTYPWQFNPPVYTDGRLIVLPMDRADVLVMDAESGAVVRAIPTAKLGGGDTVLGVRGDVLCGAGFAVACYDIEAGRQLWEKPLPEGQALNGRGQWVGDNLLIPTKNALASYAVADGSRTDIPLNQDDHGGNIVALPSELLIAGGGGLTAYVRKRDIWNALRTRMSATPSDPLPALELAEIAMSNGAHDQAIEVLAEAARRVDGLDPSLGDELARRLFDDVLAFARRLESRELLDTATIDTFYEHASRYASNPQTHLTYRLKFGEWFERDDRPERSLRLYHQILRDRSLREQLSTTAKPSGATGGDTARRRIAELLDRHGRTLYAQYESEARRWLERAKKRGDDDGFRRVVDTFPNSETAPRAFVVWGERLMRDGRPIEAAQRFANAYHRYPAGVDRADLLRRIADAYESAGQRPHAYRWLTKAAREFPGYRFDVSGRAVSFAAYRQRLFDVRDQVEPSRPSLTLPLDDRFVREFKTTVTLLTPRFGSLPGATWSRFFVHTPQGIMACDPSSGRDLWTQPAGVHRLPHLLHVNSDVAVFANDFEVFSLDASTGTRRWSHGDYPPDLDERDADWEDADRWRTHAIQGGRVLSVRESGAMTLCDIATGDTLWSRTHQPAPTARVRLFDAWIVYSVVQNQQTIACMINANTGEWFDGIPTGQTRSVEDLFVTLDGQVIVVSTRSIAAFASDTGEQRWQIELDGRVHRASLLLDVDLLYLSDDGHRVKKINLEDGRTLWVSGRVVPRADDNLAVQLHGSSLIVTSLSSVNALDAVTGLTLWRGTTPAEPQFTHHILTEFYMVAVHTPPLGHAGMLDPPVESIAYCYDMRHGSGLIPPAGGVMELGRLIDTRAVLACDNALLIQTGNTIRGWSRQ